MRAALFVLGAGVHRFGLRMRLWPNARAVLDELAQADLLFNVGGGNINSVIPAELYRKCTMHLAARAIGIPVVLSGQTIGPFTRRADRWMARAALNGVRMITLRDSEVSRTRLAEIGVRGPRLLDTGDDALGLPSLSDDETRELLRGSVDTAFREIQAGLTVAVNLKGSLRMFKGHGRDGELGHEVELFAKLCDWLVDNCDAKVMLVPTDFGAKVDDRVLHREIVGKMNRKDRVTCVEDELDDIHLKALIGSTDMAMGARYHFNVFAAAEGVPFLGFASGIYQQTKLEGLANLLDLGECYVPLDAEFAGSDEVLPYLERVVARREKIAQDLQMRAPDLVRRSATAVEYAIELIRERRQL
jgi:polysaccharide pyruvyl transferase WcaK-like protein